MQSVKHRNHRVLVIDDNRAIHDDFRKIIASKDGNRELEEAEEAFFGEAKHTAAELDVELDFASQGREGLEKVRDAYSTNPYELAFVDMWMPPGWGGLTTIEKLWEVDPQLQVVICTAYSDTSWTEINQRLQHTDSLLILKKPFDNAEVLQLTAALTEKYRLTAKANLRTEELESIAAEQTRYLREARRESELLLSSIASLLIGVDHAGVINRWNESAARVFEIAADEAIGIGFTELPIDWDDPHKIDNLFVTSHPDALPKFEAGFRDATGMRRIVELSSYPVYDGRRLEGFLLLGTDLTEQRVLEHQLHQAQRLESVGQLAAGVAHEINTPMQYLGDNLQFLKKKVEKLEPLMQDIIESVDSLEELGLSNELVSRIKLDLKRVKAKSFCQQVSEAVNDSVDGVQHVSRIVRAMKEFAHPGQESKTQVDINSALKSTIAVSTNEWKYVAQVDAQLDPELPDVPGLAGELNQVFLNILVNAAHAIGAVTEAEGGTKGKITVCTSLNESGDHVQITIEDTGKGIPDEIRRRIYDPFFTTKEVGKGTGQGLAIAHSVVVSKHGGKLWFDSSVDKGTTFYIQLPLKDSGKIASSDDEPETECVATAVQPAGCHDG